jgi:hypothetical protein
MIQHVQLKRHGVEWLYNSIDSSHGTAPKDEPVDEEWAKKDVEEDLQSYFRNYFDIFLEGLRKITKKAIRNFRSRDLLLNEIQGC